MHLVSRSDIIAMMQVLIDTRLKDDNEEMGKLFARLNAATDTEPYPRAIKELSEILTVTE